MSGQILYANPKAQTVSAKDASGKWAPKTLSQKPAPQTPEPPRVQGEKPGFQVLG